MNTTYSEIMKAFINNCGIDTSLLPEDPSKIYDMINNAVQYYNTYFDSQNQIVCDDSTESLNTKLDDLRLRLLAYCMKYIYLENQLVGFEELWAPFQNELGIKNYKSQIDARENTLERTRQEIDRLVTYIEGTDIMV